MSGSTRSYEMGRRLVSDGHDVTIITSWRENSKLSEKSITYEDGIKVIWLHVPYSNHMGFIARIFSFIKFAYLSYNKAVSIEADLIFASSTPLTISLPAIFASRKKKVPFVFEVRDLWPELPIAVGAINNYFVKKIAFWLEKFSYKNSNGIVALSDGMRDGIIRSGYYPENITVIPNGSDLHLFNPDKPQKKYYRDKLNIPPNAITILYPGTFGKINGVSYLVNLAKLFINDNRIFFVTVGDGQEYDLVSSLAQRLDCLNHNFLMLKKVSKFEISNIFECADCIISTVISLPELNANSANKFFDGLASGNCILINHEGWQKEIIERTNSGISLSQDVNEAYKQLCLLLDNPEWIFQAGKNARKLAESDFDRDELGKKLSFFLNSVYEKWNYNNLKSN
jgi:glycosyltransferase involved in cell wall biosynthesis